MPNRRDVEILLGDARQGVRSWLERQYVRGVERPHGLPRASRQWRIRTATASRYLDNLYEEYKVCVELDGTAAHSGAQQLLDKRRDRKNTVERKILTLRFGYPDVRTPRDQCETAAEVATVLRDRGPRVGMACDRPGCPV
jgi:very-short-patch-repair endonuclease